MLFRSEFALKNVPRAEIIQKLQDTIVVLESTLPTLDTDTLEAIYPLEVLGYPMTTSYFLLHLYGHLSYHLGQVNYHRRLLK